jgi:ABC-type sugar transport system permease subunit
MEQTKYSLIRHMKKSMVGWLFVFPSFVAFMVFMVAPVIMGFWYSLTDYTGLSRNYDFIGLQNYIKMFQDRYFIVSVKNNIVYAVWYGGLTLVISLALATLLNQLKRLKKLFRMVFFLPYISSMVSVAVIWKIILNPSGGPLNSILMQLGMDDPPRWLSSTTWSRYAVIIVSVWKTCGYYMLIFLAGMQNISKELYESASLDGAGTWQRYRSITLPLLSPTIFLNMILITINSFQVFDLVSVMTDGGPGISTNVLAYRIYVEGFKSMHMGYASSIAYFLFVVILLITLVQFIAQKNWVNYD